MIPALWAVFLAAHGAPPPFLVGVIVVGSLATSAAGCVVNDLWDRDIDPYVERTRDRPLASRTLSIKVGLVVALIAFGCAWGLALYLNPLSFWLCVAAVPVIVLYPLAKRVFPVPQLVMAVAWGFAVLISWSAVVARLEPATWMLWGATVLWALGFDTVYAMADREDDQRIGVHSSARFFGQYAAHAVGTCFASAALLFAWLGSTMGLSSAFWLTLAMSGCFWAWQSWQLHQTHLSPTTYGQIFRQNVGIGFLLLVGLIAGCLVNFGLSDILV
jgi:4-hydroxybenzoate polyprenyltransferase